MKIFALVDEGLIDLPAEVSAAREVVDSLDAAAKALNPPERPDAILKKLVPEVASSGTAEAIEDGVARIDAARAAVASYDFRRRLVTSARSVATEHLNLLVKQRRDQIITDHLAPAVAAAVDEARTLIAKFRPHGTTDAALLMAPKPARDAWVAFADVTRKYGALQGARASLLWANEGDLLDGHNLFSEVKNTEVIWPGYVRLVGSWQQRESAPWSDEDPAQRLIKLLEPEAVVWCPTIAEQNQRWLEVYGEAIERRRSGEHNLHATRSRFDGYVPAKDRTPPPPPSGDWRKGPGHRKAETADAPTPA